MQTILIADDNHDLRDMLGQFLAANGYRVVGAADGHEALDELDVLVVDRNAVHADSP